MFTLALYFAAITAAPVVLTPSTESVQLPGNLSGKSLARYHYGRFICFDPQQSVVSVYKGDGQIVFDGPVQVPGVYRVQIRDGAVSPDGSIALAAGAYSLDGKFVSTLIWMKPDGAVVRVDRTFPYVAMQVVFAPDGSLWTLGRKNTADNSGDDRSGATVRRYSRSGDVISEVLPLAAFSRTSESRRGDHPAVGALLLAGKDRLGMVCPSVGEYIELSWDGSVLGRWNTSPIPQGAWLVGGAITGDGRTLVAVAADNEAASINLIDKKTGALCRVRLGSGAIQYLSGMEGTASWLPQATANSSGSSSGDASAYRLTYTTPPNAGPPSTNWPMDTNPTS